jgi:ribulose-bisphosphate carboxylase large chain
VAHPRPPGQDGGYIAGTIIKPKLGLRPEPFARAAYEFWLGGDFIKNDEPQGNQVFCADAADNPAGL